MSLLFAFIFLSAFVSSQSIDSEIQKIIKDRGNNMEDGEGEKDFDVWEDKEVLTGEVVLGK